MTRVGVTGAAGFIGSHVCDRLLERGYEVVGVDDLSYGSRANLTACLENSRFSFEVLDCTQRRPLRQAFDGCEAIFHLAAKKIPRFGGTLSTLEVNVGGVNAAAAVAMSLGADLIFTSTSDVYGKATPPFEEDGDIVLGPPTTKRWAYAASKLYDEHFLLALGEERGLKATILRLFNAYGPRNHLTWWGGPVVTFYESLLDGEPMEIHGDGLQTRTFTYVTDIAEGIVHALERPESRGEIINLGGTETLTIIELAERMQALAGAPGPLAARFVPYESLPGKYQDVRARVPNTDKARRLLGFQPQVGLGEGLELTLAWHKELRADDAAEAAALP
jgi:UDP-glucose 4-epimerase